MKTTLLRLSRRAACLVLAGGLLTSCSLLPAASPRHEGTAASQAPQYYSDAWLSDDSLHYVYSTSGTAAAPSSGAAGCSTKPAAPTASSC